MPKGIQQVKDVHSICGNTTQAWAQKKTPGNETRRLNGSDNIFL